MVAILLIVLTAIFLAANIAIGIYLYRLQQQRQQLEQQHHEQLQHV